jgi:hypothetical protein
MPLAVFETTIPESEWPLTHALGYARTLGSATVIYILDMKYTNVGKK